MDISIVNHGDEDAQSYGGTIVRKILTGPGPDGRSTILTDEPIAEIAPGESRAATEIWMTPTLPPVLPYIRPKTIEAADFDVGIPLGAARTIYSVVMPSTVHGIRVGSDGVVLTGIAIGIGRP